MSKELVGVQILLADDQVDVVRTLSRELTEHGARMTVVSDGTLAFKELLGGEFDLAVVDLKMPPGEWGGLWLLEAIAEHGLKTPTLVLSGEGSQSEIVRRALRAGASDWVDKSEAPRELLERSLKAIENARRSGAVASPSARLGSLIRSGESGTVEFKSTLRWDLRAGRKNRELSRAVLKTIAAFLNTEGGTLLIGVADDGSTVGIEKDQFDSNDRFLRHLTEIAENTLGIAATRRMHTCLVSLPEGTVCMVDCEPSEDPVWFQIHGREQVFFVRSGPASKRLDSRPEIEDWMRSRAES